MQCVTAQTKHIITVQIVSTSVQFDKVRDIFTLRPFSFTTLVTNLPGRKKKGQIMLHINLPMLVKSKNFDRFYFTLMNQGK